MIYTFEDSVLDTDRQELRRGAERIPVEPQVFDLLVYLVRNRERVVSKDDLLAAVWGGRIVSESTLSSRITAVRQAIGDSGAEQRLIRTVARKGIRFVAEVAEQAAPPVDTGAHATQHSLAVLPFTNLCSDAEQEYFADSIVEDITTALSQLRGFGVVARNSSFAYKGKAVDVKRVGRELGARYVLEGSVRKSGNRVRITGQLVDAASGEHIWADRFDGVLEDVFELQDRVSASVVSAIESSLYRAVVAQLKSDTPVSDAYGHILRAMQLMGEFSRESLGEALTHLHRALELKPNLAGAMALAAYCYAQRRRDGWAEDADGEAALSLRLAERAIEIANDDGNVLWEAASAVWQFGNLQRARELAHRSLLMNPNSAMALFMAGMIETTGGNPAEGLELVERAEQLSPRDPLWWHLFDVGKALAHYMQERLEEAASFSQRALARKPGYVPALRVHAASLARLGQSKKAAEQIDALCEGEPQLTLTKTRDRMLHMAPELWAKLAEGLRLAGMPE